jgi:hypothetical protein
MSQFIGVFMSLVVYLIITFGVYKVMQVANDMSEIKDLLKDIRRNTDAAQPGAPEFHSAESLVRAVNAGSYSEILDDAALATNPEPQR